MTALGRCLSRGSGSQGHPGLLSEVEMRLDYRQKKLTSEKKERKEEIRLGHSEPLSFKSSTFSEEKGRGKQKGLWEVVSRRGGAAIRIKVN